MFPKFAETMKKYNITGLVVIGATHSLTDTAKLSEYFLKNRVATNVVCVPATLDANVRHNFIQMPIGFDTASKCYSQLIGNMLTDSASAIKYWYFIRLMGRDPSHLAVECAMRTHPNMVIISEECAFRGETMPDIVSRVADVIQQRADQGKNYGTVVIPEGLLSHISAFKHLIIELNDMFKNCKNNLEMRELIQKIVKDKEEKYIKSCLSPWSYSLYGTLPDFMKIQLINEQQILGEMNLAQVETEKLMAYFVDIELKKRKAEGVYKGSFAPVTHFFGYQGRAAHPSNFDCSLASTMGFGAGVLLQSGITGSAVSVKELTNKPQNWRIGAVPILAMLRSTPKTGYLRHQLVVPSQEIGMNDLPYQVLKANEVSWRFIDHYCNPGPIQFQDFGKDSIATTIDAQYGVETDIADQIKGLCNAINNQTMFAEHQHLLVAALSALKAAKGVLNSMSEDSMLGKLQTVA